MTQLGWAHTDGSGRKREFPKALLGIAGVVVFLVAVFFLAHATSGGGGSTSDGLILYWGQGCPHCEKVEKFLIDNKVDEKVQITRKEVYYQKGNAREMAKYAKRCGLPTDNIAVPFLWTGQTCLIGDQDIIAFFQKQL